MRLRVTAGSGERLRSAPISEPDLLNGRQARDRGAEQALTFLSYEQKFLAGSWRFDTYFGRDTLMSLQMLMPVLAPDAIEAGLRSVLARLAPDGEVAHEEAIGEFAILEHQRHDGTSSDAPIYDYGMIDGNYLLAPVVAAYLLDHPQGRLRARGFLAQRLAIDGQAGTSAGAALVRNLPPWWQSMHDPLRSIHAIANHFAGAQVRPGNGSANERDSADGLGGGRYPYDVNAVLMPAALAATARLVRSGLLDGVLSAVDRAALGHVGADADVWRRAAPDLFTVTLDNARARGAVSSYAGELKVPSAAALTALGASAVSFHAIALDAAGRPVPIVNSDEGFELLFATPDPATLDRSGPQRDPAHSRSGLLTDVGMVVANPVFATADLQRRFTNHAYHGTVIWSWQQALFALGLERQLRRTDLPAPVREHLLSAQHSLWQVIRATAPLRTSELWTWTLHGDRYQATPFGANTADADEANAAQLWSTVYLAIKEPVPTKPPATRLTLFTVAQRCHRPGARHPHCLGTDWVASDGAEKYAATAAAGNIHSGRSMW